MRKKWENRVKELVGYYANEWVENWLNEQAEEGWELASVVHCHGRTASIYFFKREKAE